MARVVSSSLLLILSFCSIRGPFLVGVEVNPKGHPVFGGPTCSLRKDVSTWAGNRLGLLSKGPEGLPWVLLS